MATLLMTVMHEMEIYKIQDGKTELEVKFDGDTVWLSLSQLSLLFKRDKSVISRHFKSIFSSSELDRTSVVAKNATTSTDGKKYSVVQPGCNFIGSVKSHPR